VIHCHGAPSSRFQLTYFDQAFADVGTRVVTIDRPGLRRLLIPARTSPRELAHRCRRAAEPRSRSVTGAPSSPATSRNGPQRAGRAQRVAHPPTAATSSPRPGSTRTRSRTVLPTSPATSTTDRARPRPDRRGRRAHPADAPAPAVVRRKGRSSAPRGAPSAGTGRLVWKTPRATRTTRLTSSLLTAQADVRPAGPGANGDTDVRPRPHDVRGPYRP